MFQEKCKKFDFFFFAGSTKEVTEACYVECKGLTTSDYVDLTWTTFAEFPGIKLYCVLE